MTLFVKIIRDSLPFTKRAICIDNGIRWLHRNQINYLISTVSEINHKRHLSRGMNYEEDYSYTNNNARYSVPVILGASFPFFGIFQKKEEPDSKLITMIKRCILLIQKEEYKKAEQMLHLALRLAQTEKNEDGITYIYDVMANLAFDTGDYNKAQKLFKAVMQRILAQGAPQDDLRIVHMSLKLAKIFEKNRDYINAENGYQYCLKILQGHIDNGTLDDDIIKLWQINIDWYAHMLLAVKRYTEAMRYMEQAYVLNVKNYGEIHEQSVVLLNDLGSISFMKGNLDDAIFYLNKAADIGEKLPDMEDISSIHVNIGNVYMKKGLLNEAKQSCLKGWKLSKKKKKNELIQEANLCLKEVNKLLSK